MKNMKKSLICSLCAIGALSFAGLGSNAVFADNSCTPEGDASFSSLLRGCSLTKQESNALAFFV